MTTEAVDLTPKEIWDQWLDRALAPDLEWFDQVLADDAVINDPEGNSNTKEEYLARVQASARGGDLVHDTLSYRERVYGDFAIANGHYYGRATLVHEDGTEEQIERTAQYLITFQRVDGRWLVRAFGGTIIPPDPS